LNKGGDPMSDSCNRPDLKTVKLCIGTETVETQVIQDGEDLLLPVDVLARILGVSLELDTSRGILTLGRKAERAGGLAENLQIEIRKAVEAKQKEIHKANRAIYEHPETGDQEVEAAALLADTLEAWGFTVTRGLVGRKPLTNEDIDLATAFRAELHGEQAGPTVAVMLEYDALPMGHGCGHNLIAAAGLAAAAGLQAVMNRLPGKLLVFGTPAEEGGTLGGKVPMIEAGHFADVDVAMITHGGDRWDTGSAWLAVRSVTMDFKGIPAHAAAAPHQGRSALDALVLAYHGIEMMREHVREDTRIHGIVTNGGAASNIVPEAASATYAVRSLDNAYLDELMERMDNVARGAAMASGCSVETRWSYGYRAPINVPRLDGLVLDYARSLGAVPVKPWTSLASSDLGNVGETLPTVNLWFAAAPEGTQLHTHEFLAAAGSEAAFAAALQAGTALALAGADLLGDPAEVARIQKDFAALGGSSHKKEGVKG
jgi:amidohydrolase